MDLKQLHDELLVLYKNFSDFCDKHNLKHCLSYGTLLGKVRHNGFIPWDDDMDLTMEQDDYNRLIELVEKENPNFNLRIHANDKRYAPFFIKITSKDVFLDSDFFMDEIHGNEMFIDIFPINFVSKSKVEEFFKKRKLSIIKLLFIAKFGYKRFFKFNQKLMVWSVLLTAGLPLVLLSLPFPEKWLWKKYKKITETEKDGEMIRHYTDFEDGKFSAIAKSDYLPLKESEYCGIKCFVPNNEEALLKVWYGPNYMTPPKVSQQKAKHRIYGIKK